MTRTEATNILRAYLKPDFPEMGFQFASCVRLPWVAKDVEQGLKFPPVCAERGTTFCLHLVLFKKEESLSEVPKRLGDSDRTTVSMKLAAALASLGDELAVSPAFLHS